MMLDDERACYKFEGAYCLPSTRATQRHASARLLSACRACTSWK